MLVLSRRVNDRIVFPGVDINVQILRVGGSTVRIGIDAPPEIAVLRHELCDQATQAIRPAAMSTTRDQRHRLRNALNAAKIGFHLAMRQLAAGQSTKAQATLERTLNEFQRLEQSSSQVSASAGAAEPAEPCKKRALLVDDNANESKLLAGYLRMSGFEVDTAQDGLEAITRLASKAVRPDVVLLDMRMPRLDGPKTVSAIRGNPAYDHLKLFAVSGMSHQEANVPVGPRGVDRWFLKPVNPEDLVEHMQRELSCEAISA